MNKVSDLINKLADKAIEEGIAIDGESGGAVHRFACANGCPDDKAFFVVFLLTAELADRESQRQGFKNQADRALQSDEFKAALAKHKAKNAWRMI